MWLYMVKDFCLNFYRLGSKASSIHLSLLKVGCTNFFTPYHALRYIFNNSLTFSNSGVLIFTFK